MFTPTPVHPTTMSTRMRFTLAELRQAASLIYQHMPPTPQIAWPQLAQATGAQAVIVKHENHTPTGSFKLRGAITFIDHVAQSASSSSTWSSNHPPRIGICTATRGNHGQGLARTATARGWPVQIYVPHGNSVEKVAAMQSFGGHVVEYGDDYDAARAEAMRQMERMSQDDSNVHWVYVPPFDKELVRGVATYALELLTAHPDLDTIYVPIGGGSGICGTLLARECLGLSTQIVAVVSEEAPAPRLAVETGQLETVDTTPIPRTIADGMAVRIPIPEAYEVYRHGIDRFVTVSDAEVADAMRLYFSCTHNVAEGAGAAPLAALLQEADRMQGKRVGVILCGGNVDTEWFRQILNGRLPNL